MTKETYLKKLENILLEKQINNTYSIIREYSNLIDDGLENNRQLSDIIDEIGSPEDIVKKYDAIDIDFVEKDVNEDQKKQKDDEPQSEKKYDNDDKVYEDGQFKESNHDFVNEFSNQFKQAGLTDPKNIQFILKIVIGIMIVIILFRIVGWFFSPWFGFNNHMESMFNPLFGIQRIIPTILIVGIVLYILAHNNKK